MKKMNVAVPDDGLIKQYEIELGVDFHDDYKKSPKGNWQCFLWND
ncbi:hypothetical protein DZS_52030 [Dickeya ananatis]